MHGEPGVLDLALLRIQGRRQGPDERRRAHEGRWWWLCEHKATRAAGESYREIAIRIPEHEWHVSAASGNFLLEEATSASKGHAREVVHRLFIIAYCHP